MYLTVCISLLEASLVRLTSTLKTLLRGMHCAPGMVCSFVDHETFDYRVVGYLIVESLKNQSIHQHFSTAIALYIEFDY